MKDNFSQGSDQYLKFRPAYPISVIRQIVNLTQEKGRALDCATGNGQIAERLLEFFREVYATDISHQQLENAVNPEEVKYSLQPAEEMNFPGHFFDLITVGQAAHWFDQTKFFGESSRVLKPGGVLALIGYQLLRFDSEIDHIIDNFYQKIVGKYWDPERAHVDNRYQEILFPFPELFIDNFDIHMSWTIDDLIGYLGTWSAQKHFFAERKQDPIDQIKSHLRNTWGLEDKRDVRFPVFTKIGRKPL